MKRKDINAICELLGYDTLGKTTEELADRLLPTFVDSLAAHELKLRMAEEGIDIDLGPLADSIFDYFSSETVYAPFEEDAPILPDPEWQDEFAHPDERGNAYLWRAKGGRMVPMEEMEQEHLTNALAFARRKEEEHGQAERDIIDEIYALQEKLTRHGRARMIFVQKQRELENVLGYKEEATRAV